MFGCALEHVLDNLPIPFKSKARSTQGQTEKLMKLPPLLITSDDARIVMIGTIVSMIYLFSLSGGIEGILFKHCLAYHKDESDSRDDLRMRDDFSSD